MYLRHYLLVASLVTTLCCFAQSVTDPAEAEELFARQSYAPAARLYLQMIDAGRVNGNIYYKAGVCFLHSRSQKHKAAPLLEKAIQESTSFYTHGLAKETDAPMDVFLHLGEAYRYQYRFEEAISSFEKYLNKLKENKKTDLAAIQQTEAKIANTRFDAELKEKFGLPPNFKLGSIIKNGNEPVGEFSSALSSDRNHMVYTLKVPLNKIRKEEDDIYFEESEVKKETQNEGALKNNTAAASKKKKDKREPSDFQQDTVVNISTIGTSLDGQVMITYRNDGGEANLYMQRLLANQWSKPQKLPKAANTKGWEPNEFISADGNFLYFASDRPGGYGGKDLYRCKKLANGEWSKAVNLGPEINSEFDEDAPFMHPDGITLYYSSNRNKPAVTYDILVSKHGAEGWSKGLVAGYPVNSSEDNLFYQVAVEKKKQLAANAAKNSNPARGPGKTETNVIKELSDSLPEISGHENYLVSIEGQDKSRFTLVKGRVTGQREKNASPIAADILLINNGNEQTIGAFKSNANGKFSCLLSPGINYALVAEAPGYLFVSENHQVPLTKNYFGTRETIVLTPLEEGSKTRLNNIFFEGETNKLAPASISEVNRIFRLLNEHPELDIRIHNVILNADRSYTGLSKERAETVRNILVEKGIDKKRIEARGSRPKKLPKDETFDPLVIKEHKPIQRIELEITEVRKSKKEKK